MIVMREKKPGTDGWSAPVCPRFSFCLRFSFRCILVITKGGHMAKNELYIERREEGDYAVRKPGSERASAILPTQAEAVERAREINPNAAVHVERVRDTNVGGRDKWRKP